MGMATIDEYSIKRRRGGMSYRVYRNDEGDIK